MKSLLYDGEHTFGITIWFIMFLFMVIFVIFYFVSRYRMALGRRRIVRRLISRDSVKVGVRFDVKGKVSDRVMFNAVKESFLLGVSEFDKEVGINE